MENVAEVSSQQHLKDGLKTEKEAKLQVHRARAVLALAALVI